MAGEALQCAGIGQGAQIATVQRGAAGQVLGAAVGVLKAGVEQTLGACL